MKQGPVTGPEFTILWFRLGDGPSSWAASADEVLTVRSSGFGKVAFGSMITRKWTVFPPAFAWWRINSIDGPVRSEGDLSFCIFTLRDFARLQKCPWSIRLGSSIVVVSCGDNWLWCLRLGLELLVSSWRFGASTVFVKVWSFSQMTVFVVLITRKRPFLLGVILIPYHMKGILSF